VPELAGHRPQDAIVHNCGGINQRRRVETGRVRRIVMARCEPIGAAWHTATPHLVVSDTRNLAVREVDFCRGPGSPVPEAVVTARGYGGAGRHVSSIDARLSARARRLAGESVRPNLRCACSLSGRELRRESVDAGIQVRFFNAASALSWTRDGRASEQRRDYDRLGRPLAIHDRLAGQTRHCAERFSYGAADLPAGANLRGQLLRHDDPAGTTAIGARSLSGRPQLETLRMLVKREEPDWSAQVAARDALLAGGGAYCTRREYNATGQLQMQLDAAGNLQCFRFGLAGQLGAVVLTMAHADAPARRILAASYLAYNAAGQLTYARSGNGLATQHDYEPATARLARRCTRRVDPAGTLQDLQYRYDQVGNIVRIEDCAQPTRFHDNRQVAAECGYVYDSLYRLIEASGRESATVERPGPGEPAPVDGSTRLTAYRRAFSYDAAGNLTQLRHHSADTRASFTQRWSIAAGSNRSVPGDAAGDGAAKSADTVAALNRTFDDTEDGVFDASLDTAPVTCASGREVRESAGTRATSWRA